MLDTSLAVIEAELAERRERLLAKRKALEIIEEKRKAIEMLSDNEFKQYLESLTDEEFCKTHLGRILQGSDKHKIWYNDLQRRINKVEHWHMYIKVSDKGYEREIKLDEIAKINPKDYHYTKDFTVGGGFTDEYLKHEWAEKVHNSCELVIGTYASIYQRNWDLQKALMKYLEELCKLLDCEFISYSVDVY